MRLLIFLLLSFMSALVPQGEAMATTDRPPFAAHRGDHLTGLKEESLKALLSGIAKGSHWADVDVRPSSTGGLFCYHDPGYIEKHTSTYLLAQGVPALKDVLAGLKSHGAPLVSAEIKSSRYDTYTRLVTLFKNYGIAKVMVSSYSRVTLNSYRKVYPKGIVTLNSLIAQPASYYKSYGAPSIDISLATPEYVASLKAAGLKVYVFTPNTAVEWDSLPPGIDGIWTDNVGDYVAYINS